MKFAFLAHPLSQESRSLLAVDTTGTLRKSWGGDVFQFCQVLHENMRGVDDTNANDHSVRVIDQYHSLTSGIGAQADGRLYEIPMDAMEILGDPGRALSYMEEAVDQAVDWGAKVVGLGSMTGIVGSHGQHLADRGPVAVTTGNSLTVFSAKQNLIRASKVLGIDLAKETVAIVGIPGSIATALAKLIAPLCGSLVCVSRTQSGRAKQVAASLGADLVNDIESVAKNVRVMISATSSGNCIDQRWLLSGTLVIDVAVPTDVQGSCAIRDDVLVLTGGMMKVPEVMSRDSMFIGFNHGMIPSCFGETLVLALEKRSECFSIGRNLCVDGVLEIGAIAQDHQFDFSTLTSFGLEVNDSQITQFQKTRYRNSLRQGPTPNRDGVLPGRMDRPPRSRPSSENGHSNGQNGGHSNGKKNGQSNHQSNGLSRGSGNSNENGKGNGRQKQAGLTGSSLPPIAELSELAAEQHERFINPVLVALGKGSGFLKTFVRGEGSHLYDDRGRQYLDFVSGFGSLNLGHNHPAISSAVQSALSQQVPGFTQAAVNPYTSELAKRLIAAAPSGLEMLSFANSGAEAIEAAIKLARAHSDRNRMLYCNGSYHGKTLGALSVTGNKKFQQPFEPLMAGNDSVDFGDLSQLADALKTRQYSAFIVEPIQCEGGMNVASADYFEGVQSICCETGTLFLLDEIQTGFGRTGKMFYADQLGITPDVMTLAKSLSGGLIPAGAMLCRRDLWMAAYGSIDNFMLHTSTFAGGSLAAAAGIATLDVLENSDLLSNCQARSEQLSEGLRTLAENDQVIRDVRGCGLLFGIEFEPTRENMVRHFSGSDRTGLNQFLAPSALEAVRHLSPLFVMQTLLDDFGIYTQVARSKPSVLRVQPPLGVTESEIDHFLSALGRCCDELGLIIRTANTMISKSAMGDLDKNKPVSG